MAGKVYIANVGPSSTSYVLNHAQIGTPGRPWDSKTYTPYFVFVNRTRYPEGGKFGLGLNDFSVDFKDTIPPEKPVTCYRIQIPQESSLLDDFILYVFRNCVLLMTKRGVLLPPNPEIRCDVSGG